MKGGQPIRVLVVDDHQIFTHALTTVLSQDGRFEVVGTAATGREAVTASSATRAHAADPSVAGRRYAVMGRSR